MAMEYRNRGMENGALGGMLSEKGGRKRLCIFCFYDQGGYVSDDIPVLLKMLRPFLQDLIIIVNGEIDERGRRIFRDFTDRIFIRENRGFDAGAYRHAILNCLQEDDLLRYDEVILCNDTFFFLPESFAQTFESARANEWDVWGLTGCFEDAFRHIQSYFLAFGRRVIERGLLREYFLSEIDDRTDNIVVVCAQFEAGLFDFLDRKCHMKCEALVHLDDEDIYLDSYYCLRDYCVPIVKKKVFSVVHGRDVNVMRTLGFIKYHTTYDVNLVLRFMSKKYGYDVKSEDIFPPEEYELPQKVGVSIPRCTGLQISRFLTDSKFYIYGAGISACRAYWRYARNLSGLQGFIVSDGVEGKPDTLFGFPVYFMHEVAPLRECRLLLAVRTEYANEIMLQFISYERNHILRIF